MTARNDMSTSAESASEESANNLKKTTLGLETKIDPAIGKIDHH